MAWANAGTPLMWFRIFHMLIGNLIIGLIEAGLLMAVFRSDRRWRAFPIMVLANYISAWLGLIAFSREGIPRLFTWDLDNMVSLAWVLIGIAFVLTLFLEWPFVAWYFKGRTHWLRKSMYGILLTQAVSYTLLVAGYHDQAVNSLTRDLRVVPAANIRYLPDIWVFYIDAEGPSVQEFKPDSVGTNPKTMIKLQSHHPSDYLYFEKSTTPGTWDLFAAVFDNPESSPNRVPVKRGIQCKIAGQDDLPPNQTECGMGNSRIGEAPLIVKRSAEDWTCRMYGWPDQVLHD
jgi:hypothetical protein